MRPARFERATFRSGVSSWRFRPVQPGSFRSILEPQNGFTNIDLSSILMFTGRGRSTAVHGGLFSPEGANWAQISPEWLDPRISWALPVGVRVPLFARTTFQTAPDRGVPYTPSDPKPTIDLASRAALQRRTRQPGTDTYACSRSFQPKRRGPSARRSKGERTGMQGPLRGWRTGWGA